jgi:hypothetical protein
MIKATMLRQVGLARFKFATSKTVYTKTFLNNTQQSSSATTIAPSTNFVTNKPYLGNNATYFFFTKAKETTTFNSNPSDANHWKEAVNITLGAGEYTSDANIVTVKDNRDGVVINSYTYNYDYQGTYKQFTMPGTGKAVMECWGAQGGRGCAGGSLEGIGGKGGYAKGTISLSKNQVFYVYVGGKGGDSSVKQSGGAWTGSGGTGGWNGGGAGVWDGGDDDAGGGGGGATDIRITSGSWNAFASLKTRIMVAGGGGGASYNHEGGSGGGINGGTTTYIEQQAKVGYGTQTSGYKFGSGAPGARVLNNVDMGGGGSGYYGAPQPTNVSTNESVAAGGGSGFVSGMTGCNAINSSSTESKITHTGSPNHYSGFVFTNASMTNGSREGHGYCRITCSFE